METTLKKFIGELESIDVDLNWYHESYEYQKIIDSQFDSILERLDWALRRNSLEKLADQIKKSLSNIQNIVGQFDFIIEILKEELKHLTKIQKKISNPKRIELIDEIAYHLQVQMVTTQINALLSGYGVETEDVEVAQSKRVYVQQLLRSTDSDTILQIATDLGLHLPSEGVLSVTSIIDLIEKNQLNSVLEDFNRALKHLEADPEQAVASSSSTLESICKAIIELEGQDLPKKQTMSVLLSRAIEITGLDPKLQSEGEIKRILGGIQNVILGVGALRTGFSTAHGHGIKKYKLSTRHVRLLVNSMITFGTFILETYITKRQQ